MELEESFRRQVKALRGDKTLFLGDPSSLWHSLKYTSLAYLRWKEDIKIPSVKQFETLLLPLHDVLKISFMFGSLHYLNYPISLIGSFLGRNPRTSHLEISYCPAMTEDFSPIVSGLIENTHLEFLRIAFTTIHPACGIALAQMLKKNRSLRTLDLERTMMTSCVAMEIVESLEENSTLHYLNIRGNSIAFDEPEIWSRKIAKLKNLKGIHVGDAFNDIGSFHATLDGLSRNHCISMIDISENGLHQCSGYFSRLLKENYSLKKLIMSESCATPEVARLICSYIAGNGNLEVLGLGGGTFCSEDVRHLAHCLEHNVHLRELDLSRTENIDSAGWTAIAEMLKKNRTLRSLNLSGCNMGDEGCTKIAKALCENRSLRSIDLSEIGIEVGTSCKELSLMMKTNQTLHELFFPQDNMDEEMLKDLSTGMRKNFSLNVVHVGWATWGDFPRRIFEGKKPNERGVDIHWSREMDMDEAYDSVISLETRSSHWKCMRYFQELDEKDSADIPLFLVVSLF
eukprot:TRINITY_DN12141_c0_g1_i4.p1 TRINITY_DN12141_c0_g1~~TRINITY_DN12141_c0_g1_i4.p1  ORF type:complete len:513 (-),score=116.05 TRINITY_DN12141_c0_g1_i4:27-1565(-)